MKPLLDLKTYFAADMDNIKFCAHMYQDESWSGLIHILLS